MKSAKERRVHPRLAHKLPLNLEVNGYDFSTISHNISSVGAYCHLEIYATFYQDFRKIKPAEQVSGRQEHDC
jgi:hypothetical protein